MELELGLKITRTREDVSSSVDFRFSKDPFGPLVLSRETDSRFIIIIHLKGFKKGGIEIEINKEGNRITIRGRKPVEEMVLIRWMAWKREVELRAFRKVFQIPDVVDLDKIKARFDDDDATLTITMPKIVKGISGFKLEEEERGDSGDVSEVENREEVEEENVEREESDEHSQIQREMMENKERENHVSEGEEKGFSGGLGGEETHNLEKIQQIEQDKILEFAEEETVGQQDLNTESDDVIEQESNEEVMEKQVSQVDTKRDDVESRAFEQEPDEQRDRTSKSREMEKKTTDGDGLSMVQGIEEPERHNEENNIHEMVEGETGGQEKKKIVMMEIKNKDAKEEVDGKMGEGDIAETETKAEEFESDKLVEKKEEKEENSKVRRQSENRSLIKLQETEEQHSKGQKRQEKTPEAETTKEQEPYRPKILGGQEKIQELAEERRNLSRKVEEEEETAEKKTEFSDDDMSRKDRDIEQQDSDAMKGQDEKDKIQELVLEEKVSDGRKGIIAVAETIAENDMSRKVQQIDEQQSHEEDKRKNQFHKLLGGDLSGHGEVEDVENEKRRTEADKRFRDGAGEAQEVERKDSDVSGNYGEGEELQEKRTTYQNEQEEEKEDELVDLKNQLEQDKVEDGEKTQELVEENIKDCREKESETKTNDVVRKVQGIKEQVEAKANDCKEKKSETKTDDVVRKVQGIKEQELYEPKRDHVSKIKELVAESEDECGGLSKVHGSEEQELHEPNIHKERDKTRIAGREEEEEEKIVESMIITEKDSSTNIIAKKELKTEEGSSKMAQEIEKHEYDKLQRSTVQDKMQETEKKDKTREMEENEIVERRTETEDGSLRKVREGEDPELGRHKRHGEEDMIQELMKTEINDHREKAKKKDIVRSQETGNLDLSELERHCKQRKTHQSVEDEKGEGNMEGDSSGKFHEFQKQKSYEDWRQEESEEIENFVKEKATDPEDKHTGGNREHEEERYEKVAETKTKVEDEINKKVRKNKETESDKQERYGKLDELGGLLREGASDRVKEKILVDDFTTDTQETEKEESHESERHEKLDIVQDFVEDETGDQEDEKAEEAAAVVANNEKDSLRRFQTIEEQEGHKEQNNTPKRSDLEVKEEDEERVAEKERQEAQVQELEGKGESCKDDDGEGRRREKGKQWKTFEKNIDDRIVRKIRETKVQESNGKNDQEPGDKIEKLERKETSNHEVKLVTEDDSLRKGQEFLRKGSSNVSKRRPVEQEKIQKLKEVEKREDAEKAEVETKANNGKSRKFEKVELDESEENEELTKTRKPMEEKTNAPEKEKEGNEKIAEEEMQDKIDSRIEDQAIKRQEPHEILEKGKHDKIQEPIVEGTKYHREEEKGMADRESEEMKRVVDDVSSKKVEKIKAQESDGLEKLKKLSEIQENQSVEEKIQGHGEEEMNEGGRYKTVLKTKSMEDSSQSQDVEEKGSDQTERYAEQEKIQELTAEEDRIEEYHTREGEQKEKAMRILQVDSKANDDSSKKNETEGQESTRLRRQRKKENNQRREEEKEEVVEKAETVDEYDSSRKIHEHGEQNPDKLERNGEVEMSGKLAEEEINDEKEGNRAGAETKIRDGGFEEEELAIVVRHREQDKKQSFVEKDTSVKAKENKNQETKSRDDTSRKTQEKEKQESHEQKRSDEEQDKKMGQNYCRSEEDGKEDKEISEAEGPRKLKGIENRESTKTVERNENRDNIQELVEERMKNQEGENKKSMITEVLEKPEHHESKGPEGLRKEDKSRELVQQRLTDNLKDEETAKTETKSKDIKSRKIHQIKQKETCEEERRKEKGRIKELVEDRTHHCRGKQNRENEFEDGSSKKIQEIAKEESIEPGRNDKRDEIQEPVDKITSEDDEEELEVEFEDSEEDWEAEVIQEMDSDEDNDKIRQIRRIKLGFRLVGGSALFMSLIVIVIRFVRSKRKIRCYKF